MEEDFTALLSGALSEPVHWRMQPILQKAYPYVNLSLISAPVAYSLEGETGAQEVSIQVDCWANTYSEAVLLARSVAATLSGYSGAQGSTVFHGIFSEGERDVGGDVPQGDTSRLYGRSADYRVRYT